MIAAETLGRRLGRARRELAVRLDQDVSQADLAEMVGVSGAAVSRWEADVATPNAASLKKLADVLQVTRGYLLFGEGPKQAAPELNLGVSTEDFTAEKKGEAAKKKKPKRA